MPKIKVSDSDRKKISVIKRKCPCITNALIAYIFDISACRVGEILREDKGKKNDIR